MDLIKKLEQRAREFDRSARSPSGYNQQAADDRELLLETTDKLKTYEWMIRRFVENLDHD